MLWYWGKVTCGNALLSRVKELELACELASVRVAVAPRWGWRARRVALVGTTYGVLVFVRLRVVHFNVASFDSSLGSVRSGGCSVE